MVTGSADEPIGLRERQKRARREALVDAAHELVARDGLDAVTVEAIAARAGVSTRTFFNYFETKDDAVLGMQPLQLDARLAESFASGGPTGALAADLEALAASLLASPLLDRRRVAAAAELARQEPRLLVRHVTWLEQYRVQLEELLHRRLDGDHEHLVDLAGMTLMVLVRAAMQRWESTGGHDEVADHLGAVSADFRFLLGAPGADPPQGPA